MRTRELNLILDVLQERKPSGEMPVDWYSVLGFLEINKIAVVFYHCAKKLAYCLPQTVERQLRRMEAAQTERNAVLQEWAGVLGMAMKNSGITFVFLKGTILQYGFKRYSQSPFTYSRYPELHSVYAAGERTSNDIDILVSQSDLDAVHRVMQELGFRQGVWDDSAGSVRSFTRRETITRRMNRGEIAPYVLATKTGAEPFIEVDINFSLSSLPDGAHVEEFLAERWEARCGVFAMEQQKFFLHLLLHQYKEISLFSMIERGKDALLYKLFDIYAMIRNELLCYNDLLALCSRLDITDTCCCVLSDVANVFDSLRQDKIFQSFLRRLKDTCNMAGCCVTNTEQGKEYVWAAGIKRRIREFCHTGFLKERT